MSWEAGPEPEEVTLRLHYDTHGSFLEVPVLLLILMEMPPEYFSVYSRIHENRFYLEEDLDTPKFLKRFNYLYGGAPAVETINHGDTALAIRDYPKNSGGQDVTIH